jgi:hypothetical protein
MPRCGYRGIVPGRKHAVWRLDHESRGPPCDLERIGLLHHANNLGSSHSSSLVIDEDATDRALPVEGLQHASPDYHILEASNGSSGLVLYHSQRID